MVPQRNDAKGRGLDFHVALKRGRSSVPLGQVVFNDKHAAIHTVYHESVPVCMCVYAARHAFEGLQSQTPESWKSAKHLRF